MLESALPVPQEDATEYRCRSCGTFQIEGLAELGANDQGALPKLSAWIRENTERKSSPPLITKSTFTDLLGDVPELTPVEKQLRLLQGLTRHSKHPGAQADIDFYDFPLAWADNADELDFHAQALMERGYVRNSNDPLFCVVTTEGWELAQDIGKQPLFEGRVFVAMSFNPDLKEPIYENAIKPGVRVAGYDPHRVDEVPHLDKIDNKIIADIRESAFIVADMTEHKHGVYFEAGFAMGLARIFHAST